MIPAFPCPLSGIVPPLVTPLLEDDTLDVDGLGRLIEHVIAGGVNGLFLLGTTGEGPCLSYALRRQAIERAVALAAGRVPVLIGITDTSFAEMIDLGRFAAEAGADAVVASTPYYLVVSQAELLTYIEELAERLPLPLVLYNMPGLTKVSFGLDVIRRSMDIEQVVGLKDSSGDLTFFNRVQAVATQRPDWSLLVGPEELLLQSLLVGGHGGVSGGANLFPRLYVELHRAAVAGDLARAAELHRCIMVVSEGIYRVNKDPTSVIKGIKCALSRLGICNETLTAPLSPLTDAERDQIRVNLDEIRDLLGELGNVAAAASIR